jgi:PAB1-binding protein PBP1
VTTYRAQHLSLCKEQLRVRGKSVFASRQREKANTMISRNSKEMNTSFSKAIANTHISGMRTWKTEWRVNGST